MQKLAAETIKSGNTPVLYHGTRMESAQLIIKNGFRRSRSKSYTGHGVCLSESITIAYEYGMYETGGCVLEVRLSPETHWADDDRSIQGESFDRLFRANRLDALNTFGGNVWILWNCDKALSVREQSHREAIQKLVESFEADGPGCGYNNLIDDYASIWWDQEETSNHLQRFPEHRETLVKTLMTYTGRARSAQLDLMAA